MTTPEIQELIRVVESKYGRKLNTTTDFDCFSLHLKQNKIAPISTSTLKRLWGYVNDSRRPRKTTLDALAMYAQHSDFDAFVAWLKNSTHYNSSFFTARQVSTSQLNPGDLVEVGWAPNRMLKLRFEGDSRFVVLESVNSKLQPGDAFITGCFILNYPLYLPYVERKGEKTLPFIAGRNGGLTTLKALTHNE